MPTTAFTQNGVTGDLYNQDPAVASALSTEVSPSTTGQVATGTVTTKALNGETYTTVVYSASTGEEQGYVDPNGQLAHSTSPLSFDSSGQVVNAQGQVLSSVGSPYGPPVSTGPPNVPTSVSQGGPAYAGLSSTQTGVQYNSANGTVDLEGMVVPVLILAVVLGGIGLYLVLHKKH